ncbi:MAG: cobyric acid synthase [Clostridium tyrobutyricum]|jgi:adenosylcobyric acid synthase|uniref:cobyric acid synthase n=1 Tax=Clostridium tyrobutyricum TaxID=1519 RepID=UPI001C381532|nr:cobyric acid synthase [Clostridium tyrobutyricum]MBV4415932.1 cobyric acid synthase [Clostridium tyrobutyricum]MBV4418218.1 cobyric acid synthase [Clostridium tyrobutyricum]MCH4198910.1 cobyric acid synthase [Clostridium tyrobutyricum]MCH4236851.1 cobyric acid synthase [Clostridium tyrobutyricum]MCH4258722.1 cobyric acid synthase [Clostridium tyrobutyricum]
MAKIMIQGTGSSVGKSIIVTALCRIFMQDGYSVSPFKSQNMSLNSYITLDGKEMGRAQVLQAYAAGLEPQVYMNPILLKPTSDRKSQIIVNGEVYGNATAVEYHNMKLKFREMLKKHFLYMESQFDIIVMEGAGSPAEINLRDRDIVNMGMAEIADAPVILVGDIDKGGVFASLAGTMLLLKDNEKKRVKGTIINKFRGDIEILKPGLDMLEDIIKIPGLGVVPYFDLNLEDEDGAVSFNKKISNYIDIAVVKSPHISNFTDFDALRSEEDVSIRFVTSKEEFGNPDILILPGSKNTIEDLIKLRENGLENCIKEYSKSGIVIGICGGYQMLGNSLKDPYEVESSVLETQGMGLLDIDTVLERNKVTTRVEAKNKYCTVHGYEIHMGNSKYGSKAKSFFEIVNKNGVEVSLKDGAVNYKNNVIGTYIHGVFDDMDFRQYILNIVRDKKHLEHKHSLSYDEIRENELDKLADIVRSNIDMKALYDIVKLDGKR